MTTYSQLDMFALAAALDVETRFHATLTPQHGAGAITPETPATRPQAQENGIACPLCGGRLEDDVCQKCGMAVSL